MAKLSPLTETQVEFLQHAIGTVIAGADDGLTPPCGKSVRNDKKTANVILDKLIPNAHISMTRLQQGFLNFTLKQYDVLEKASYSVPYGSCYKADKAVSDGVANIINSVAYD